MIVIRRISDSHNPMCGRCGEQKPESEFKTYPSGKRMGTCKTCFLALRSARKVARGKTPEGRAQRAIYDERYRNKKRTGNK